MYDMYPDWGPARHRDDDPANRESLQRAFDRHDDAGERPDDN